MPIKVKHFTAVTPNAGDTIIALKSRDLIREIIPDADIMTLAAPLTNDKINLFGTPDIIVIGGGPLFGSKHLSDIPQNLRIPVYLLGIGAMIKKKDAYNFQSRLDSFTSGLKNIRLASVREYATSDRLNKLGIKCRVIGCPSMHLSREPRLIKKPIGERDKDTLIINYRAAYLPERLLLDQSKALDIAKRLGFNQAIIVAHSYSEGFGPRDPINNPITAWHQRTLKLFLETLSITRLILSNSPLKKYVHPAIHNSLDALNKLPSGQLDTLGMKFYDVYAYLLLYQNLRLLISYQLHASIMAAAVCTPFLHLFIEESDRVRDMIETYDPDLELHLPASSSNFEDVISKARSILENPDPLHNYLRRVDSVFEQWELFKEEMRNDLKKLKLII